MPLLLFTTLPTKHRLRERVSGKKVGLIHKPPHDRGVPKVDFVVCRIFEICRQVDQRSVVVALVGNKIDLADVCRVVSYQTGKTLAEQYNLHFYETSAKTGVSVNELFLTLAENTLESTVGRAGGQLAAISGSKSSRHQQHQRISTARNNRRQEVRPTFSWKSLLCCF